jgi:hypothetical protein
VKTTKPTILFEEEIGREGMSDEFQVLDSPANNTRFTLTRFDKLSIFLSIDRD